MNEIRVDELLKILNNKKQNEIRTLRNLEDLSQYGSQDIKTKIEKIEKKISNLEALILKLQILSKKSPTVVIKLTPDNKESSMKL